MKEKDVKIINEVYQHLAQGIPLDQPLFERFTAAVENLNAEIAQRKQRYNDNAELFRERTKQWRKDNPDRKAAYQIAYRKRDYVKKYYADLHAKKKLAKQNKERNEING